MGEREVGLGVVGLGVVGLGVLGRGVVGRSVGADVGLWVGERERGLDAGLLGLSIVGLGVVGLGVLGRSVGANVGLWVGERERGLDAGLFVLSLPVTAPASKASKNRRIRFASRRREGGPRHDDREGPPGWAEHPLRTSGFEIKYGTGK